MKGHKAKRATGGVAEYEEDLKDKPMAYNKAKVEDEAEERKSGGRAKRKSGGKTVDKMEGCAKSHMGRKPRKSGGSCDSSPMSSARGGKSPYGAEGIE